MRVSKLPASQQLVGTVTPAFDQPRAPALPLQVVCHLLGSGYQLHSTGLHQPALTLAHRTTMERGEWKGNVRYTSTYPLRKRMPYRAPVVPLTKSSS